MQLSLIQTNTKIGIMTKEEVIKQAYGEYYHLIRNHIGSNGSVNEVVWLQFNINIEYDDFSTGYFRPKSLKGLETNNGWIKIESEQDLPKDQTYKYDLCHISKDGYLPNESFKILKSFWESGVITHYQPSFQREKPLY